MKNTLILTCGASGSGKTTLAYQIADWCEGSDYTYCSFSADEFWYDNGEYRFDKELLSYAHKWCQGQVAYAMYHRLYDYVIVDNTNLTKKEREPYESLTLSLNWHYEVREPETVWRYDAVECFRRNKHNVPMEVVERMLRRFDLHPLPHEEPINV